MNKSSKKTPRWVQSAARRWPLLVAVVVSLILGYAIHAMMSTEPGRDARKASGDQAVEWWTCSMHPQIKLPKPGLCPLCSMKLIPLVTRQKAGGSLRELVVGENAKKLMEIETVPVERRFAEAEVGMVGKVDYDETRLKYITAWIGGRLDRLYVDYTGVPVKKGDHLVYLYSPELLAAQEELLQAVEAVKKLKDSDVGIVREMTEATIVAVREKLRLWGLTPEQIAQIETRGKTTDHMTIYAPTGGIVIHKNAQEGMYVKTGTRIYTIADLSRVWVRLDAYESDLMWLRYGQKIEFTTEAYPGQRFVGTVAFIDPILTQKTRTVKIRINAPNPKMRLKPGMFVRAVVRAKVAAGGKVMDTSLAGKWICPMHPGVVKDKGGECDICQMPLRRTSSLGYLDVDVTKADKPLVIPASAALITGGRRAGSRAVVYVQMDPSLLRLQSVTDWPEIMLRIRRVLAPPKKPKGDFLNTTCPIKGTPLDLDNVPGNLTREYGAGRVAFCCPGCPEQWDKLTDPDKRARLARPAEGNRPLLAIWNRLPGDLRERLLAIPPEELPTLRLRYRLIDEINKVLKWRGLHEAGAWKPAGLPPEARDLIEAGLKNLPPMKVTRLNRLLLQAVFAREVAKADTASVFEGREVVLGPRAGNYYLVRHGLFEGEFVVTKGNFKIDAELQIQARPSMMTPEGGGGGGGHGQHGQKKKKTTDSKSKSKVTAPMKVPAVVKDQLLAVLAATGKVNTAIESGQLSDLRGAFAGLGKAVRSVQRDRLEGHMRLLWKEHSMFLGNDAVEGMTVKNLSEGKRVVKMMNEHAASTKAKFGLVHPRQPGAALAGSETLRKQFGPVVEGYLAIQRALATDKALDVKVAANEAAKTLAAVDVKLLEGDAHTAWTKVSAELKKDLSRIGEAETIIKAREGFALLSDEMIAAVKRFGTPEGTLYGFKCPMAFGGRGATWMQRGDQTKNPYFGSAMLRCGEVTDILRRPKKQGGTDE